MEVFVNYVNMMNFDPSILASDGRLSRPIRQAKLVVPRLAWIENDHIWWDPVKPSTRPMGGDLVESFTRLRGGEPQDYLRFAKRWGVLGLCEHDLPYMHNWPTPPDGGCSPRECLRKLPATLTGKTKTEERFYHWEPLEIWRQLVSKTNAWLNLAAAYHLGKRGLKEDWRVFGCKSVPAPKKRAIRLMNWIDAQLRRSSVYPTVVERPDRGFSVEYCPLGNFNVGGALALQLLLALCRTDGLSHCDGCGNTYVVTGRRPNPKRRNYCDLCSKSGVSGRDAARDYRERQRPSLPEIQCRICGTAIPRTGTRGRPRVRCNDCVDG